MALSALLMGWLFFANERLIFGILMAAIFVFQAIELIQFFNRTNREIAFFFDAIRNDDSTLHFPENKGNKSLRELNASLNKVNELIKKIKFELLEQEHYYKTILEHVSIGIITFNENGNIFLANTAARTLLNHEHLTHIMQISQVNRKLFSVISELQPGDRKLVSFNGKAGVVQLSLKSTQFKTARQNLQLVAIQDIKSEMETKELESWIKLIRVLTHEIMNSVAPIISLSQTISGYFKNPEGILPDEKIIGNTIKGLEVINERGAGLISFVENYRKLTRLPQPDKKQVKIGQLFEKTITLITNESANEHVKITWKTNPPDLEIVADKEQISQVLINLIKNSLEALKNSGDGEIELGGGINSNGRIQLTVSDNGPGISQDLMDKVFIPFFTTKESGSGIGLSLSQQIMMLHGGRLKLVSVPGKQTMAVLEF